MTAYLHQTISVADDSKKMRQPNEKKCWNMLIWVSNHTPGSHITLMTISSFAFLIGLGFSAPC